MKKLIKIILIIFIVVFCTNSFSYSDSVGIKSSADDFLNSAKDAKEKIDTEEMKTPINDVAGILAGIGVSLIVIIGVILGIKFMLASTEEQAKIKESMIPYAVGALIIFGAAGIWKIVVDILNAST